MPLERTTWLSRIKAVEREHLAVRLATDRLLEAWSTGPSIIKIGLTLRDIRNASERLEGTYIMRIFAEFETGLRSCWTAVKGTEPPGRSIDLVNGMAANRRIPHNFIANVHSIREYRNELVHEREAVGDLILIAKVCDDLYKFFARLPFRW